MAVPDFQSLMRPLLTVLADGQAKGTQDTVTQVADILGLSDEDRQVLMPSGKAPVIVNRIAWAKLHLKRAGLITSPARGVYQITEVGSKHLSKASGPISMKDLIQYKSYREFRALAGRGKGDEGEPPDGSNALTPEEQIENGYEQLRRQLAAEILEKLKHAHPRFFESVVVELLVAMGYGGSRKDAGEAVKPGADGGVDGVIREDRLGLGRIYVQAKKWDGSVSRPEIQKFAGALQGVKSRKGIFITTSTYTKEAREYAKQIDSRIVLIEGTELAELMIDHNVGVATVQQIEIKRLDNDYFAGEE